MTACIIPSFGFSGSGFLACYHLGAAKCLLEHGYLLQKGQQFTHRSSSRSTDVARNETDNAANKQRPMLTGVSGGSLIAASMIVGVDPEVAMQTTLAVARRTRQEGFLDAFQPG